MTNLPLQALYYFLSAAELGSLKAAAEEMNATDGATSRQIRLLKERLNVQLLTRQRRKVVLSSAGRRLLPYAKQGFIRWRIGLHQAAGDFTAATRFLKGMG